LSIKHRWNEPALRNRLIVQLAAVLGVPSAQIDPAENLEECGLDSINAVTATERIGKWLGIKLPPEFLFKNRSVDAAVRALLDTRQVKVAPIFFFPGGGGRDESALVRFRARCPLNLTFEVVPIGAWRDWIEHDLDFDKLASRACQHIEAVCADGPLQLAGYSQGGQLAYVTALALTRAGRQVEFVSLLDSTLWDPSPPASQKSSLIKLIKDFMALARPHIAARIRGRRNVYPPGDARIRIVRRLWELRGPTERRKLLMLIVRFGRVLFHGPGGVTLDLIIQIQLFSEMWGEWLAQNHTSTSLHTPVLLFRSKAPGIPDLGWASICSNLTVVPVTGDHHTMFGPDHLEELITRFAAAVGRV
jgi:thioesterase domain-containing protein/acyl carrier protein